MSGGSDKSKTGKYGILGVWKFGCFFYNNSSPFPVEKLSWYSACQGGVGIFVITLESISL